MINFEDISTTLENGLKQLFEKKCTSDEKLKNIFGEREDLISLFSKIHAYDFNYNDKAKELYKNGENNVDDDNHVGVMAQELEVNPATQATVSTDPNTGYKQVNTSELVMVNSAVISELCRRIEALEKKLGDYNG